MRLTVIAVLISALPAFANDIEASVAESDDFEAHKKAFVEAATKLISAGTCTAAELSEQGGFWKSQNHKKRPIYFTYCGGDTVANRIYLDVVSGNITRTP